MFKKILRTALATLWVMFLIATFPVWFIGYCFIKILHSDYL